MYKTKIAARSEIIQHYKDGWRDAVCFCGKDVTKTNAYNRGFDDGCKAWNQRRFESVTKTPRTIPASLWQKK